MILIAMLGPLRLNQSLICLISSEEILYVTNVMYIIEMKCSKQSAC